MKNADFISPKELTYQLPGHVYWLDVNNVYLGCNDVQAKVLGLTSSKDIVGKKNCDLMADELAEICDKNNFEVINSGIAKVFEEPVICNDGTYRIFLSHKKPLLNKRGNIIGLIGISEDITVSKEEKVKLKSRLEEIDLSLEHILSNIPGHVYWKNKNGIYMGCNDLQAMSLGFKYKYELIGKTDFELTNNKMLANILWKNDCRIMHGGIAEEIEEEILINGKKVIVLSSKTPLKNKNGDIVGVVGISIDITDRKEAEKKLIEAKQEAEVANHAKTEFIQNMRHDLRNSLTGIVGCSELLTTETDITKANKIATMLEKSSKELLNFLNKVLESINTASGQIPLVKKQFNLKETLEEVVNLHLAKAFEKKLTLKLSFSDNIPKLVIGDPVRIYRIVLEILSNALKFTDQGYVHVSANIIKKNDKNLIAQIFIEDTGIGIPENSRDEIFERFKRLTPSYQGIYPGSGLGLFIAKQFIEDLEGEIYVDSQLNKGTKFSCIIPLKETLIEDPFVIAKTLFKKVSSEDFCPINYGVKSSNVTSNKIYALIVDDDKIVSFVTTQLLKDLGCEVDVAQDGATAIVKVKNKDYDLIAMDIGLPDISGFEVTKKIRSHEVVTSHKALIVGVTGHVIDSEMGQRSISSGMDLIFTKPLSKETIKEVLSKLVCHADIDF